MTFSGTLHPYQQEPFERMVERRRFLLAHEMGLGKTVTTIAALEHLMDCGDIAEPGLVIALSSLKYQWAKAIKTFSGGATNPVVIDGPPKQRAARYEEIRQWETSGVDVAILNYETVVNDFAEIMTLPLGFVVIDEATAIKSFRSKRSRAVKKLKGAPVFYGLTGTPIENGKPEEVFSIMQAVDETVLGRFDLFDRAFIVRNGFGGVERYRNLPLLHQTLTQAMDVKKQNDPDVAPYLPTVLHHDPLLVPFDKAGRTLYRRIATDLLADLDDAQQFLGGNFDLASHYGGADAGGEWSEALEMRGKIMSKVTCLRLLCDHPDLLRISATKFHDQFSTGVTGGSQYAALLADEGLLDPVTRTPKMDAVVAYARDFLDIDPTYKMVIFSAFVPTIGLLADRLSKYAPNRYDGSMNAQQKEASKVEFQTDPACRILISSDAGGYGVDLPQANLLVNYDLPWAAGAAKQRDSRIIRASSEWDHVVIQAFLMEGSIEERQWASLQQKDAVAAAVVEGKGINAKGGVDLSLSSLRAFLQSSQV